MDTNELKELIVRAEDFMAKSQARLDQIETSMTEISQWINNGIRINHSWEQSHAVASENAQLLDSIIQELKAMLFIEDGGKLE